MERVDRNLGEEQRPLVLNLRNLGNSLVQSIQYSEAVGYLREARERNSRHRFLDDSAQSELLSDLAEAEWGTGHHAVAIELFQEALKLARSSGNTQAAYKILDPLPVLLLTQGQLEQARAAAEEAFQNKKLNWTERAVYLHRLALLHLLLADPKGYEAAVARFEPFGVYNRDEVGVSRIRILAAAPAGVGEKEVETAVALADKLAADYPRDWGVLYAQALALLRAGKPSEAQRSLDRIAPLPSGIPQMPTRLLRALAKQRAGHSAETRTALAEAVQQAQALIKECRQNTELANPHFRRSYGSHLVDLHWLIQQAEAEMQPH
jgi:tetratricopeptide (TPR) repeat protein